VPPRVLFWGSRGAQRSRGGMEQVLASDLGYGGAAVGRAEPGDRRKFGPGDADAYTVLGELRARSLTARGH
jgi:hypothetical protein